MRKIAVVLACLVVVGLGPAAHARLAPESSDNIKQVANVEIGRVTEVALQGRHAYALTSEAVVVIDRATRKVVGKLECQGIGGTEIETFPNDMIAFTAGGGCGIPGVAFADVSNPKRPRLVGGSQAVKSHTITSYPGQPFIYVSPNGCCGDTRGGIEEIIDARNPQKPEVVQYRSNGIGCHDVGFLIKKDVKLAACAGGAETQIWDVSDPLAPVTISRIPTPQVFFNHSATFSPDGKLLVVGDEAHGVTSCTGAPTGALWFYDVSDPAVPTFIGYYGSPRGSAVSSFWATPDTWCTAHMYAFKPGTRLLATAWYEGGINVLDLSEPSSPEEVGYYWASGEFSPWAPYWDGNEIWTSDEHGTKGGVEVFSFKP
jgi:hypothetical protein